MTPTTYIQHLFGPNVPEWALLIALAASVIWGGVMTYLMNVNREDADALAEALRECEGRLSTETAKADGLKSKVFDLTEGTKMLKHAVREKTVELDCLKAECYVRCKDGVLRPYARQNEVKSKKKPK